MNWRTAPPESFSMNSNDPYPLRAVCCLRASLIRAKLLRLQRSQKTEGIDLLQGRPPEIASDDRIQLVPAGTVLRSPRGEYHSFESHSRFLHHPFRTFVVGITAGFYPS